MREEYLVRAFVEFSDTLVTGYDIGEFLNRFCERCADVLEVSAVGVLLEDAAGQLELAASSTGDVQFLESMQVQRREGPCLDAYRSGERVTVADLGAADLPWPAFAARASSLGLTAVCAFPMRLRDVRLGALNIFLATSDGLDELSLDAGQALADVATIAILQARAVEDATRLAAQLAIALDSRVVIEQAKGVLAERLGVGPDEAFRLLRRHARLNGLRLTGLAQSVVDGTIHELEIPPAPSGPA
jgi:transcriptional regulator with GAF, ATPase, and Fis domain